MLAYAFLHSSVHHLLGNVFSLLFISYFMIIEVKPTWQAVIFLVSSIFSGLAYIAFSKGIVVGASGGIFSMTGTYITLALYDWAKTGQRQVGLMLIGVLCIINLLLSFARTFICTFGKIWLYLLHNSAAPDSSRASPRLYSFAVFL